MVNEALPGFTEPVQVKRWTTPVVREKGRVLMPNDGVPDETFTIDASVQQARADEIQARPDLKLERTGEVKKLYTTTRLKTVDNSEQTPADVVVWNGDEWRVIGVDFYGQGILDHYRVFIQRAV
jgi:hypothetical protein